MDETNTEDAAAKAFEEAAAEEARAQAEARRKRILEKANKRLGVVSGEQVLAEEDKKTSASNAARIRAARQRRYGKKTAAAAPTTPPKESPEEQEEDTKTDIEDTAARAATTTLEDTSATTTPEPPILQAAEPLANTVEDDSDIANASATSGAGVTAGAKKYMGVAKMRRKMIAKKKLEEEDDEAGEGQAAAEISATSTGNPAVSKVLANQKVAKVPIYMHIFIAILLFVAGLDVGIQQFHDDVVVHTETAIHEFGLPFVHRKPWEPLVSLEIAKGDSKRALLEEELLSSSQGDGPKGVDPTTTDEFGEVVDEKEHIPNIDPIFGIDLDEMTKGPGIFNQLGRGAIAVHRMILWMLYYTPLNIFNTILSLPVSLMKTPPALFLIALILRQILGKVILGAHIPEASADGPEEKNNIEVIGMAKSFVKNFFVTNFPMLVWAYDVFVHLRADMYIVLCGVFCGLAWSHLIVQLDATDGSPVDTIPADGMTDEL